MNSNDRDILSCIFNKIILVVTLWLNEDGLLNAILILHTLMLDINQEQNNAGFMWIKILLHITQLALET